MLAWLGVRPEGVGRTSWKFTIYHQATIMETQQERHRGVGQNMIHESSTYII